MFPRGLVKRDESFRQAVLRELDEELGLKLPFDSTIFEKSIDLNSSRTKTRAHIAIVPISWDQSTQLGAQNLEPGEIIKIYRWRNFGTLERRGGIFDDSFTLLGISAIRSFLQKEQIQNAYKKAQERQLANINELPNPTP